MILYLEIVLILQNLLNAERDYNKACSMVTGERRHVGTQEHSDGRSPRGLGERGDGKWRMEKRQCRALL